MSRVPMRTPRFERSRRGINGFMFTEIDYEGRRLQLVNMHLDPLRLWTVGGILTLPTQLWWQQRAIQRDELQQAFSSLKPGLPTILFGDLNRVNDGVIDGLRDAGYTDSFAVLAPRPDRFPTLSVSILGFRAGRRIDFIFHDNHFETTETRVVRGRPSDHDAVLSFLRWKGGKRGKVMSEGTGASSAGS